MTGVFTRERRGRFGHRETHTEKKSHMKVEAEPGVTLTQNKDHQEPQKLQEARKACGPRDIMVSDSGLPNCDRRHFCCFKPLSWWYVVTATLGIQNNMEPRIKGNLP